MKVQGKTILVTGGGSGIGRELTLLLLKKGARVAALDVNTDTLKETETLAGDHQEKLTIHPLDITDRPAVEAFVEAFIKNHGQVDGVVNNAGIIQKFVKINDLDYTNIERNMSVNFWGTVYLTKALLPHLLKRPEAHIVNVSSMGGFLPVPGQTAYGASKAAVKLFTEGLRSELLPTNVHVTIVFPGAIATNIAANSGAMPAGGARTAEESKYKTTPAPLAAEIIVDGMEKNKYRVLVGSDAKMMDSLYRLMPDRAAKLIFSQMRSLLGD